MSTLISEMQPEVAKKVRAALAELDSQGVPYAVTYTFRTYAEQAALYAQGRKPLAVVNAMRNQAGLPAIGQSENAYTVTNADGMPKSQGGKGRSPHQLGTAIDVVPKEGNKPVWPNAHDPRWIQIAAAFKKQGFEWGGEWKDFPDRPHYQYPA